MYYLKKQTTEQPTKPLQSKQVSFFDMHKDTLKKYNDLGITTLPTFYDKKKDNEPTKRTYIKWEGFHKDKKGIEKKKIYRPKIEKIKGFFSKTVNYNCGFILLTGKHYNFFVVDLDTGGEEKKGLEIYEYLKNNNLIPNNAPVVRTGGGGIHIYYKYPKNKTIKTKQNIINGLDTRADGGIIVAPPSEHKNGFYKWIKNPLHEFKSIEDLPNAPRIILDLVCDYEYKQKTKLSDDIKLLEAIKQVKYDDIINKTIQQKKISTIENYINSKQPKHQSKQVKSKDNNIILNVKSNELYIKKKKKDYYVALCPFHETSHPELTPLHIDTNENYFKCHSPKCNAKGKLWKLKEQIKINDINIICDNKEDFKEFENKLNESKKPKLSSQKQYKNLSSQKQYKMLKHAKHDLKYFELILYKEFLNTTTIKKRNVHIKNSKRILVLDKNQCFCGRYELIEKLGFKKEQSLKVFRAIETLIKKGYIKKQGFKGLFTVITIIFKKTIDNIIYSINRLIKYKNRIFINRFLNDMLLE